MREYLELSYNGNTDHVEKRCWKRTKQESFDEHIERPPPDYATVHIRTLVPNVAKLKQQGWKRSNTLAKLEEMLDIVEEEAEVEIKQTNNVREYGKPNLTKLHGIIILRGSTSRCHIPSSTM